MQQVQRLNEQRIGKLTGCDCPACKNRGFVWRYRDGEIYERECPCMGRRRNYWRMERSGLAEMLEENTMDTWVNEDAWHETTKKAVLSFAEEKTGWLYICGTPGTGKTHICTALCGIFMEQGIDTRFFDWLTEARKAKSLVLDTDEYCDMVEPLKTVPILYIDDLFKTQDGTSPTRGDVNLAREIICQRYNNRKLLTVISTEVTMEKILDLDEALGSRIYERTRGHYIDLTGKPNWRLTHG